MRQRFVVVDIAIHKELFLIFHIVFQLLDNMINIGFFYLTADFIQTRKIDFISFYIYIINVGSGFEKCLERVDLELFGSSVSIHFFLSGFSIDDKIFIIRKDDTEIRSSHHVEIFQFRDRGKIKLHTFKILFSRLLDIDHLCSSEIMLDSIMSIALDKNIEIMNDFLDDVFKLIINILTIIMFGKSEFMISIIGGIIPIFGSFELFSHLFYDTILEWLDITRFSLAVFQRIEIIGKQMMGFFTHSHIHTFEIFE